MIETNTTGCCHLDCTVFHTFVRTKVVPSTLELHFFITHTTPCELHCCPHCHCLQRALRPCCPASILFFCLQYVLFSAPTEAHSFAAAVNCIPDLHISLIKRLYPVTRFVFFLSLGILLFTTVFQLNKNQLVAVKKKNSVQLPTSYANKIYDLLYFLVPSGPARWGGEGKSEGKSPFEVLFVYQPLFLKLFYPEGRIQ